MVTQSLLFFVLDPENVKRLGPENCKDVERLTLKNTEYLFGYQNAETHLCRSNLSLGIYNDDEDLCGVVCLYNHPNIPAVPPWEWEYWLHNLYHMDGVLQMCTMWIHYSVWHRNYTTLFLRAIMQRLFQEYEALEQVMYVCPPGIQRLDFIEDTATRILPVGFLTPAKVQTVYMIKRADFVAQYTIRRAVEEDNDDLVAIIPKELEDKYGHYYISELLSNPDQEQRQIIVAEHKGCAVGILCLNETVNYDLLNEEFELVPYHGLKKPDEDDKVFLPSVASLPNIQVWEDAERLPSIETREEKEEEWSNLEEQEQASEDDFSLLNLSSSLILNYLFDEDAASEPVLALDESGTSIESHFSAVILNEEYQDHLYNADRVVPKDSTEMDERGNARAFRGRELAESDSIPKFLGEPNAFAIEICTALAEHEICLYLLFQAAFECFPDRDYCIVSFPPDTNNYYLMKHFARVVPRPNSVFHHELYVLHKNAILGRLSVRVAVPTDVAQISELIAGMIRPSVVEDSIREAVENPVNPGKGYVFLCEDQVIGCAVVSEEQEHEFLELNYHIDAWINIRFARAGSRGCLDEFLVSPIFQRHVSFFLRELHRMSDFRVMFYRLKRFDYMFTHRTLPIINALCSLAPVHPNPVTEYDAKIAEEYQLPHCLVRKHTPFALYLSSPRLTSMPQLEINQRLVVVGAGFTTLAFLEALLVSKNPTSLITFNNITVVSPHGLGYHKQPSPLKEIIFVGNGYATTRYMDTMCFRTYVHVVTGVMTAINRKEKYVALNDDSLLPYDYLFLMCGEQFQKPPQKIKDSVKEKKKSEFPTNVFIINTEADATNAFNALKNMVTRDKKDNLEPSKSTKTLTKSLGRVVVYGHYLEACCCLSALLEFGVAGSDLVYIDPTPDNGPSNDRHDHLTQFFNNGEVETAVLDEMLGKGITIYQDYNFVEWHMDTANTIKSAKFESKYKFVELELMALFIYHAKGISTRTFQAIAKSGLVFNGRLVIDKNFQTNDPCIYAAGPFTMYSKKYHAEHLMHKYYNGEEIGCELALEIRRKLVPKQYWDLPPRPQLRRKPIVQHCQFPGNLNYLHVTKPGKPVPMDVAINKSTYGKLLITGDCNNLNKQGYFRLHLNQYNTIETITCLTKSAIHVHNLISIWGKHEALFNNMVSRYQMQMIPDLFEYFNQPWACAIYHKSFNNLMEEISYEFIMTQTTDGKQLVEEVKNMLMKGEWSPLSKLQCDEIEEMCRDCGFVSKIEEKVLDFIHQQYQYLPMYVHKMFIRWIMHQIQTSPLYTKTSFIIETDEASRALHHTIPFFRTSRF